MKILPVVILAGGLGTRLIAVAGATPKVLIPILGKPFLAWKLDALIKQGVTEVYLLLGSGADQVRDFLAGYKTALRIITYTDGENLLGTAGAIRKYLDRLPEAFILTFGDNLLDFNLQELSQAYFTEKKSVMVCTSYKEPEENFNVQISGTFVYKYDKRYNSDCSFMDYGYSVLELNNFKELQLHQAVDLEKVIQELVVQQKLIALTTSQEYFEIGTPEGLERTINWLSRDE